MGNVNFNATQAFVFHCSTCGDRFVGCDPGQDEATERWMRKHANWHAASSTVPPRDIVLP